MIRCGNRRAAICPSCSDLYAADTWQLVHAGACGGHHGIPDHREPAAGISPPSPPPASDRYTAAGAGRGCPEAVAARPTATRRIARTESLVVRRDPPQDDPSWGSRCARTAMTTPGMCCSTGTPRNCGAGSPSRCVAPWPDTSAIPAPTLSWCGSRLSKSPNTNAAPSSTTTPLSDSAPIHLDPDNDGNSPTEEPEPMRRSS